MELIWYSIYVYNIVWDKHQNRKASVRPIHRFSPFYILWKLWNTERLWSINFDNISAPERMPMREKIKSKHYYRMWTVIGQRVYMHNTYVVKNASEVLKFNQPSNNHVNIRDPHLFITVPAVSKDASNGALSIAGTRLTKSYEYFRQSIVYHLWYHVMLYRLDEVFQSGRRDVTKSGDISRVNINGVNVIRYIFSWDMELLTNTLILNILPILLKQIRIRIGVFKQ